MINHFRPSQPDFDRRAGFALVASLSIMAILVLIGVALFSLSSVASRNAALVNAKTEAEANAKMALMTAIGELQKQLGPDQRISANGAITAETPDETVAHPRWTGVWDAWVAGDPNDAPVSDIYPSEPSHHATIDTTPDGEMHPDYANKDQHFRAWLLSLSPGEAENIDSADDLALDGSLQPGSEDDTVQLLGVGSLGTVADGADPADFISARLLPIDAATGGAPRGRYGWWVGDESQKARIMGDSYITDADTSLAARLSRQQAPGSMGTRTIPGLEGISDDLANEQSLDALPSLKTISLIDGATPDDFNLHDATLFSYGVLADVREGGLKRDLSTLLERPVLLSEDSDDFMLYRFGTERVPIQDISAYYQLYRQAIGVADEGNAGVQYNSDLLASGIQISTPDYGSPAEPNKFLRQYTSTYKAPVPIKLQFLLGMAAGPRDPAEINTDFPDTHELFLTTTLSITLWNPTNLPMVMDNSGRFFQRLLWKAPPLALNWNKNGGEYEEAIPLGWLLGGAKFFVAELDISRDEPLRFEPGEVKVLSIPSDAVTAGQLINFQRFDSENADYFNLKQDWFAETFLPLRFSAASVLLNG